MVRLVILIFSLLSVSSYAQENQNGKHYQFGIEVQQYTVGTSDDKPIEYFDSKAFIDNYQKTMKSSRVHQFLATMLTTTPSLYEASLSTIKLNETYHTQQKLDELIKTQKRTNTLLTELISKLSNS